MPNLEHGADRAASGGSPDTEGLSFGEYYYAHDCGIPYERNDHWNAFFGGVADRLIVALDPKSLLDAGCAIGMLVEAMRVRGVEAYGIDVSEWAIENMPDEVRRYCRQGSLADPIDGHYDVVTCIEVLEHIPQPDDDRAIEQLCRVADRILISSSPHDYSEPTHVTVRPQEDWAALFARQGFVRDLDFDATFLTPWAVLYRRNDDQLPEVVRRYERVLVRAQDENSQLRSRALQMQDQLAKDYSATSIADLRQELLAVREELVTATAEAGDVLGRIRELEDERDAYRGAADELAGFKRSKVWSSFELYPRMRRKLASVAAEAVGPLSQVPPPDLSLIVVGAGPFGAPLLDPALTTEIVDCAGNGADARRDAISRARGRFITFVDAGDRLRPDAGALLGPLLAGTDVDVAYTDDDVVDEQHRHHDPFLKPAWSPERLLAQEYLGRLTMVRRELAVDAAASCSHGGSVFEHELVLRVTEVTDRVQHVDSVVYHHRHGRKAADPTDEEVRAAVVGESLRRRGASLRAVAGAVPSEVRLLPAVSERPRVSVIIPTAGTARRIRGELTALVLNCVDSILAHTAYPDLEILCVVDGTAPEPVRAQLHDIESRTESLKFKVVPFNEPFNFSVKINRGVAHASGEHLLLLNDDIEVTDPAWIDTLVAFAANPEIGAVGPRLLFEDGRLQHVGVVLTDGHTGHPFYGYRRDTPGYFGLPRVVSNQSAVTAACMLTRRSCFEEVGGFSNSLAVNYNDVDYCLKLRRRGYRIVYTPELTLWHYESSSRGFRPPEQHETDLMRARWGAALYDDPYYSARFVGGNYITPVTTDERAVDAVPLSYRDWARRWIRDVARVERSRS